MNFLNILEEIRTNPLIALSIFGVILLLIGLVPKFKEAISLVALIAVLSTWCLTVLTWHNGGNIVHFNMISLDDASVLTTAILLSFTILIFLMTDYSEYAQMQHKAEFFALQLFALCGAIIMISFKNLLMLFIGIEILSISLYILAGFNKRDLFSLEASLKYFLMGSFFTGFLLMGIALVYGTSGSLDIVDIRNYQHGLMNQVPAIHYAGVLLIMIAMAFKLSAAPFHFWAPDVYQGAPTPVSTFMATVVKTTVLVSFYRIFYNAFFYTEKLWSTTFVALIILTLVIPNLIATKQNNFKRLLSYSGVANVAFMLMVFLQLNNTNADGRIISLSNVIFYLVAYNSATIIAFLAVMLANHYQGSTELSSLNGLYKRSPWLAAALTIAMCSMAGIPITAGFMGKYYMLMGIIENGYLWLAVLALIFSAVSFYYYFAVVKCMFFNEETNEIKIKLTMEHGFILIVCVVTIFVLGLAPQLLHNLLV